MIKYYTLSHCWPIYWLDNGVYKWLDKNTQRNASYQGANVQAKLITIEFFFKKDFRLKDHSKDTVKTVLEQLSNE